MLRDPRQIIILLTSPRLAKDCWSELAKLGLEHGEDYILCSLCSGDSSEVCQHLLHATPQLFVTDAIGGKEDLATLFACQLQAVNPLLIPLAAGFDSEEFEVSIDVSHPPSTWVRFLYDLIEDFRYNDWRGQGLPRLVA